MRWTQVLRKGRQFLLRMCHRRVRCSVNFEFDYCYIHWLLYIFYRSSFKKPSFEEWLTSQWLKEKGQIYKQLSTKQKATYWVTRTPLKTGERWALFYFMLVVQFFFLCSNYFLNQSQFWLETFFLYLCYMTFNEVRKVKIH